MHEDPSPLDSDNEFSLDNDDSNMQVSCLKGERVDPHLRIHQVDKLLVKCEYLSTEQRRLLVSRRNTAKLRLRQKNKRDYSTLIRVELDIIQEAVSAVRIAHFKPFYLSQCEFYAYQDLLFVVTTQECASLPL